MTMDEPLTMDGFDDCILGHCERFGMGEVIAYDKSKVIKKLMLDSDMTYHEALEYFEYNQLGAWMGEGTPVFVTKMMPRQAIREIA